VSNTSRYTLSHYSRDKSIHIKKSDNHGSFKPKGLWLSVDGPCDWLEWCEGEGFGLDRFSNRFIVTLKDEANVVVLHKEADFERMNRDYGHCLVKDYLVIDWDKVAEDYDGILIPKYHWEYRMQSEYSSWYYP
jgi:hypothetical protein